jgi:hypothetical protein
LAEVYNWFTGRFDTADLQEAKALLEALGRSDLALQHTEFVLQKKTVSLIF